MSRGLAIGGGLLLGGGALAYALSREDVRAAASAAFMTTVVPLYEAEVEGAKQVVAAAKKGALKVTDAAQVVWSKLKLPSAAAQNIVKYKIGELVDAHREPIPKWMALAIIHTETGGTFDPTIYNYPFGSGRGGVAYARPGAGRYGGGLFAHDPHAIGLFQILQKFKKDYSRYGGFDHELSIAELLDPENNVRAGLGALKIHWQKRITQVPQANDADKLAMLYFCHNQGGGYLDKGLKATTNKLSARDVIAAAGAGMAGAPLTVALATATRGELWAQLGDLKEALA